MENLIKLIFGDPFTRPSGSIRMEALYTQWSDFHPALTLKSMMTQFGACISVTAPTLPKSVFQVLPLQAKNGQFPMILLEVVCPD